jgi:hypothetical protein
MQGKSRVIVTCMKNECPYVLEWIAYHLEIGFTHFVVATNGCADGTVRMLKNLERAGLVTHVPNPPPHRRGPQKTGYFRCRNVPAVRSADWLMTLDIDEYLAVYVGDGTLDALVSAADAVTPGANMISLQWLMFGHNGQVAFEDRPVTEAFTRSAEPRQRLPTLVRSFKTLWRAGLYEKLGTHRPNAPVAALRGQIRWVDGSGRPMPEAYIRRGWAGEIDGQGLGIRLGRINHYAVRSVESFLIKRDRGDVNPAREHAKNRDDGLSYWKLHDWNLVGDRRILRQARAVTARIADLKALPQVAALHDIGVAWHKAKAAELEARPEMAALKAEILALTAEPRTICADWLLPEDVVV